MSSLGGQTSPSRAQCVADLDGGLFLDGESVGCPAEGGGEFEVALSVDEEHGGLGDPGGPFVDLDAVEVVEGDLEADVGESIGVGRR
jgi:hypothetical protein